MNFLEKDDQLTHSSAEELETPSPEEGTETQPAAATQTPVAAEEASTAEATEASATEAEPAAEAEAAEPEAEAAEPEPPRLIQSAPAELPVFPEIPAEEADMEQMSELYPPCEKYQDRARSRAIRVEVLDPVG